MAVITRAQSLRLSATPTPTPNSTPSQLVAIPSEDTTPVATPQRTPRRVPTPPTGQSSDFTTTPRSLQRYPSLDEIAWPSKRLRMKKSHSPDPEEETLQLWNIPPVPSSQSTWTSTQSSITSASGSCWADSQFSASMCGCVDCVRGQEYELRDFGAVPQEPPVQLDEIALEKLRLTARRTGPAGSSRVWVVRKLLGWADAVRWKHVRRTILGAVALSFCLLVIYVIIQIAFPPRYDLSTYNEALRTLERRMEERRARMVSPELEFGEFGVRRKDMGNPTTRGKPVGGEDYETAVQHRKPGPNGHASQERDL